MDFPKCHVFAGTQKEMRFSSMVFYRYVKDSVPKIIGVIEHPAKAMGSKVGIWGKCLTQGGIKSGSYQGTVQLYSYPRETDYPNAISTAASIINSTMVQHCALPQLWPKRFLVFLLLDFKTVSGQFEGK